ncbi:murein L,D-transpeptidase catalytic domain family protein [Pedobacter sp. P351]|uniref:murein L,D-transpeptidase catalytic domain family protein n=1 Tax=Pedobacter superstes TaxID=3133441 RepID=UPI0030A099C4
MKKRIFRGAAFVLLTLSVPALGWGLKEKEVISNTSVPQEQTNGLSTVVSETVSAETLFNDHITKIYDSAGLKNASLDFEVYKKAITGYYNLKSNSKLSAQKQILSIVDFSKPSTQKRLWIVDLASNKLLFHTLVAHGRGSGGLMASQFSNTEESYQSSLGFYVTDDTYFGKHGLSLRLKGLDKGLNTNALARAIVVHGADYVSQRFVDQNGYLGRSHGCPALPVELTNDIIKTIKGNTALFIYSAPVKSDFINTELAVNSFMSANQALATL